MRQGVTAEPVPDGQKPAQAGPLPKGTERAAGRWIPGLIFAVCVIALIGVSIFVLSFDRGYARRDDPQTDNAYVGGDVTAISARVQGYLTALPVADYQAVHAGDLIARVEDRDYAAERDRAQAAVQAAEAQLVSIGAQQRQLAVQISVSQAGELGSKAAVVRTVPELERQKLLIHTDVGESRALDRAEADQKNALASIASSHAQYQARRLQTEVLAAQRKAAEAALAARRADLVLADLNLGWTRIVAPVDGMLGARQVRVGDLLAAGSQVVGVTPLDTVWVDANFTERQATDIHLGQRATIKLDTFPSQPMDGVVTGLSPITGGRLSAIPADNTTGNFTKVVQRVPVRITILWGGNPLRGLVRPGMSAIATVLTGDGR